MRALLLTVLLLLATACSSGKEEQPLGSSTEMCTPAWFEQVEAAVQSGDGQGHGPDIGSEEWKSVIEFRLGVRGEPGVPERNSNAWCQYIDILLGSAETPQKISSEEPRPRLLVIGVVHFNSSGLDAINLEVEDVMAPLRQRQIQTLLESLLSTYSPTHIAVEYPRASQPQIDDAYRSYLNNDFQLRREEQHQLGYRLGKLTGLEKIYGVDWNGNLPGDLMNYDWVSFAKANDMQTEVDRINDPARMSGINDMSGLTITEWLAGINSPERLESMHQVYFDIAQISSDNTHPGANWVGTWYARNLKILNNISHMTSDPDARIVVFYGAGHAYLLNQLARESGDFEVVTFAEVVQ